MPSAVAAFLSRFWGAARRRCPVCRKGQIFRGAVTMNTRCPVCRYVFEREPGYFLGAIAIGYFIGVGIVSLLAVIIHRLRPALDWEWAFMGALLVYLLFTPLVFQYARTVWMYVDNVLDPPEW